MSNVCSFAVEPFILSSHIVNVCVVQLNPIFFQEDETGVTVKCEPSVVNDLWVYRSAFHYPELDRVKVTFPKSPNSPFTRRAGQGGSGYPPSSENLDTTIRIFGPKGCVEVKLSYSGPFGFSLPAFVGKVMIPFINSTHRMHSSV